MKTDHHIYALFRACPEFVFMLAGLPSPGPCRMEQVTIKEIARTMDGLITPVKRTAPLTVVEFQFQPERTIYCRTVIEMAAIQRDRPRRSVQGLIVFLNRRCDPRTAPWTKVVRAVYLESILRDLEARDPAHPLVHVFKPFTERSDAALEKGAAAHYKALYRRLPGKLRLTFQDVFLDWMMQRFKTKSPKEITAMIANWPPVEETACGKELISIGVERGLERGLQRGEKRGLELGRKDGQLRILNQQIIAKFGKAGSPGITSLRKFNLATLEKLGVALLDMKRPSELNAWLASH